MRLLFTVVAAALLASACSRGDDTAVSGDWRETSFTDERGMEWMVAVSTVSSGANRRDVQGWAGAHNRSGAPMLIEGVQNCAFANPVALRTLDGAVVDVDPFGNADLLDDGRCTPQILALPAGETLWLSSVLWKGVREGEYELFGTFWNGKSAALRFDI